MKRILLLLMATVALTSCYCDDDYYYDYPPMLKLVVLEPNGAPLVGAEVKLFTSAADYENLTRPVRVGWTDSRGEIIFDNLRERVYYFDTYLRDEYHGVEFDNSEGINYTRYPLEDGEIITIEVRTKMYYLSKSGSVKRRN